MLATLQTLAYDDALLRLHRLPLAVVDSVFHLGIEILPCSIQQMEGSLGLIVNEYLLFQIHAQCLLTVA